MSTAIAEQSRNFKRVALGSAGALLDEWVGSDRAAEAKGRIAAAFSSAALAARDPSDFYACTPSSVAQCVAIAALTGIMPSTGAAALAYLVPQRARRGEPPMLQYMLSHRGIAALAKRGGSLIFPIPVGYGDKLTVVDGEVSEHEQDIDDPPTEWDDLRGVVVVVKDADSGAVLFRGWVPKKIIEKRRAMSRSAKSQYGPWNNWPIPMAMKSATHYAVSRGWVVIDDTEAVRALSIDAAADVIDVKAVHTIRPTGLDALGLGAPQIDEAAPNLDVIDAPRERVALTTIRTAEEHLEGDQIARARDLSGVSDPSDADDEALMRYARALSQVEEEG